MARTEDLPCSTYILADGEPVPDPDMLRWGEWFETADRHVAETTIRKEGREEVLLSTVFLGIDGRLLGPGPPLLWETMIFGGVDDGFQRRYASRAAALADHAGLAARLEADVPIDG